jgi:hypothetical protein
MIRHPLALAIVLLVFATMGGLTLYNKAASALRRWAVRRKMRGF